ncbi:hypothetical protein MPER_06177, partial [Moniliophthora perniciosa FA553]
NQNALHGNINRDLFQDACALRELSIQQEGVWREWPLLATDGDLAAMVDFRLDTSQPQRHRPALHWNSKKADDDHMEPAISRKRGLPRAEPFCGPDVLLAQLIMWLVSQAGKGGVTKEELSDLLPVIGKLVQGSHPLLYWVGYKTPLLIGAAHMQQWTVVIYLDPMMRILPRRWMNINGYKMMNIWQAACRA